MKKFNNLNRIEFEYRIFISLGIVAIVCSLSILFFRNSNPLIATFGNLLGVKPPFSSQLYFLFLSLLMALVSLLRMWAGSILSAKRVMSFKIKDNLLIQEGPYTIVRNPIYLSDLIAMAGFSLCFPLPGILLPVLFYIHYIKLIKYEESSFSQKHNLKYSTYILHTPRMLPSIKSLLKFYRSKSKFTLNRDGLRHNSLYILFVPGFIVASILDSFISAIIIGIPAVIDWAIIHTKIGLDNSGLKTKNKKVFEDILFALCWEDPQTDRAALHIQKNDIVFSITSGGCNVLSYLLDDPAKIISLDINKYQNYLLELKISLIKNLSHNELLEFLGIRDSLERVNIYESLKHTLSDPCREYWDNNSNKVKRGIIHCGRYEKYMALIRFALQKIIGRKHIRSFFEIDDPQKRKVLFEDKWNNIRWNLLTRVILSRRMMILLFDKSFFRYLDQSCSFGKHFAQKAENALTRLPIKENYFLSYILTGKYYNENCLPPYLRKENYDFIKSKLSRIQIITGNCSQYFSNIQASYFSKFNFSNIFEWMPEHEFEKLMSQVIKVAKDGAILCYRNLLVKRERPPRLSSQIISHRNIALDLQRRDLSFIYNNFVIEQIIKDKEKWNTKLLEFQKIESLKIF